MSSSDFRDFNKLVRSIFQNNQHPESPPPAREVSQPRKEQEAMLASRCDGQDNFLTFAPDELDWGAGSLTPEEEREALRASKCDGQDDSLVFPPEEQDWGTGGLTPEEEREAMLASKYDGQDDSLVFPPEEQDWGTGGLTLEEEREAMLASKYDSQDDFSEFAPDESVWETGGTLQKEDQESIQPGIASDGLAHHEMVPYVLQPEPPKPLAPEKILGNAFGGYNTFNISIDRSLSVTQPNTEEQKYDYFSGFQREQRAYKDSVSAIGYGRPTAKKVTEKLKKIYLFKVYRQCLYIFNGKFYQYS